MEANLRHATQGDDLAVQAADGTAVAQIKSETADVDHRIPDLNYITTSQASGDNWNVFSDHSASAVSDTNRQAAGGSVNISVSYPPPFGSVSDSAYQTSPSMPVPCQSYQHQLSNMTDVDFYCQPTMSSSACWYKKPSVPPPVTTASISEHSAHSLTAGCPPPVSLQAKRRSSGSCSRAARVDEQCGEVLSVDKSKVDNVIVRVKNEKKCRARKGSATVMTADQREGACRSDQEEKKKQSPSLTKQKTKVSSAERVEKMTRHLGARQSSRLQQQQAAGKQMTGIPPPPLGLPDPAQQADELEILPPAARQLRQRQTTRKPRHTQRLWRPEIRGEPVDRWRSIGQTQGLSSDTEIAVFLMGHYENIMSGQPTGITCVNCQALLTLTCMACRTTPQLSGVHRPSLVSVMDSPKPSPRAVTCTPKSSLDSITNTHKSTQNAVNSPDLAAEAEPDAGETEVESPQAPSDGEAEPFEVEEEGKEREEEKVKEKEEVKGPVRRKRGRPAGSGKKNNTASPGGIKIKLKLRKYKCSHDGCEAAFAKSSRLKIHNRIHTGEKPYVCKDCGKAFTQKSGLTVHSQKHSGLKPFKCDECGSAFPSSSTLKQHMRRHTGEKPFKCKKCPKTFRWSGHLTQHMRAHDGIKPFLCPDCGKSFSASSDLAKHRVTHTKSRPYKCDKCDKAYSFQHRLTAHQRSHTGDRPFLCQECGAAFARAHNLTVHIRTHTGDKPYWCQDCGAKFSDSGNFCKHKKTKHGDTTKNITLSKADPVPGITSHPDLTTSLDQVKLPECERLFAMAGLAETGKLPSMVKVASEAKRDSAMLDFLPVGRATLTTAQLLHASSLPSTAVLDADQSDIADFKRLLPPISNDQPFSFPTHLDTALQMGSPPLPVQNRVSVSPALSPTVSLPPQSSSGPSGPHDNCISPVPQVVQQDGDFHTPQHDGVVFPPHYPGSYPYLCQQQQ